MGLSNQERVMRVTWSIKRMQELVPALKQYEEEWPSLSVKLSTLVEQLWPTLLRTNGDGLFWIMGSKMNRDNLDPMNLFHIAMVGHGDEAISQVREQMNKMHEVANDEETSEDVEEDIWYGKNCEPDLDNIIHHGRDGAYNNAVMKLYAEIENCQYAMNRYHDKLAESMNPLRDLCAMIHGKCFEVISAHTQFFEAYLLNVMATKLMAGPWDSKKNLIFALFKRFHLQHEWTVRDRCPEEIVRLMAMWKRIKDDKLTNEEKVIIVLSIAGKTFGEYPHYRKELEQFLREFNKGKNSKARVKFANLMPTIKRLEKQVKERKREDEKHYAADRYCWLMHDFSMTEGDVEDVLAFHRLQYKKSQAKRDDGKWDREDAKRNRASRAERRKVLKK